MKQFERNPRKITDKQLEKLEANIWELGDISGIVHDLNTDEIISGNQRCKAIDINACGIVLTEQYEEPDAQGTVAWGYAIYDGHKMNYRQVRWTQEQRDKANITANSLGGDWDWDILRDEWAMEELKDWGVDLPADWDTSETDGQSGQDKLRKGWHAQGEGEEAVCDMVERLGVYKRGDILFLSFYKKSEEGIPLSAIKVNENVPRFAEKAAEIIKGILHLANKKDWCIITAPVRRHKDWNFSEAVCTKTSSLLGIPFYPGVLVGKNRQRINAEFSLVKEINEPNIIVFDDILTTGSTLHAVSRCLSDKNVLYIIGINNN